LERSPIIKAFLGFAGKVGICAFGEHWDKPSKNTGGFTPPWEPKNKALKKGRL